MLSDKGLIQKIERTKNQQKKNQITQFKRKRCEYTFLKEDTQIANKQMKRCSISIIIREMHIKTPMRGMGIAQW